MLRRVARVLRVGLFLIGSLITLCLPASMFAGAMLAYRWADAEAGLILHPGTIRFIYQAPQLIRTQPGLTAKWYDSRLVESGWRAALWPTFHNASQGPDRLYLFSMPLWLLAFLCLAWPVTSFLLARRRRGRGFPVEAH